MSSAENDNKEGHEVVSKRGVEKPSHMNKEGHNHTQIAPKNKILELALVYFRLFHEKDTTQFCQMGDPNVENRYLLCESLASVPAKDPLRHFLVLFCSNLQKHGLTDFQKCRRALN